jgi:hypothetical protein
MMAVSLGKCADEAAMMTLIDPKGSAEMFRADSIVAGICPPFRERAIDDGRILP